MELAADQQIRSTRFGRYEALLRIGRGGMAEVFAGRVRGEAGFQKLVAVKRMLPHLADDEKFAAMFLDEARLAANISSPHVVSTLDLGRSEDGSLYLVMELIIGVTLSSLLRNAAKGAKQIPVGVAVEILAQAAQGLHDAHEARTPAGTPLGIVHRDVSPQNVLIGADGRARITDFGVARAMLRRTDTTTGELKGKLAYFSPEQVSDDHIDRRSDVFALGIVAWETLTGRRLFKAENPLALLDRITNMPIPSVTKFHADVPAEVDAVVQKALERDREKRFASTQDFSNALREAARQTLPLPDRSVMSAFVQEAAGDRLKRMEESIRVALDDTRASNPPGGAGSLSAFPDAGSGVTMRSDADTNRRTGGSRGSSHPTRAQNPASTTKWRPSESGRSRSTSSQSTSSQATRGATRPSRPGGVPAPPPSFDNDDGPTVGEAPRARDGATKDFLLPDAGAGLDAMDNEATSLQPPAPLPKEAFGATHTGSTASRRGEPARSPRYSLADDGEHEGATVQAAPIFSPDSDAPSAEAT
ncbi:MAG: serine/threonine protein kinase, partial [Myxococcales bacterium]|nr:serine/threonine protein kinase [Myxococcales bacterium]